jgi:hypothetical protein
MDKRTSKISKGLFGASLPFDTILYQGMGASLVGVNRDGVNRNRRFVKVN